MASPGPARGKPRNLSNHLARIVCIAVVAVQGFLPSDSGRAWGVGYPSFLPDALRTAITVTAILLLAGVLWLRIPGWTWLRAARIWRRVPFVVIIVVGGMMSASAFWLLRDSTHLLGDGGKTILDAVNPQAIPATEPLATIANRGAVALGSRIGIAPVRSLELLSCLVGVLAVLVALVAFRWRGRALLPTLLLTGAVQLFFGYVESYPIASALMMVYLGLGVFSLQGRTSPLLAGITFGLAVASHLVAGLLLPAHIYLIRGIAKRSTRSAALTVASTLAAPFVVIAASKPELIPLAAGQAILPLGGPYGILSPAHLLDLLNELLLIIPLLVPLSILACRAIRQDATIRPSVLFLSIAALGGLALALAIDPALGMARDWDLLALCILPFSALLWHSAIMGQASPRTWIAITIASLAIILPWVAVNHREPSSVARFRVLLDSEPGRPGTAYGYETLGIYLREHDDPEAIDAFAAALRLRPGFERYRLQLRDFVRGMEPRAAHERLSRIVNADSSQADVAFELMLLEASMQPDWPGLQHLSRLDPDRQWELRKEIGKNLFNARQYERASGEYAMALDLASKDLQRAETLYLRGLALIGAGNCSEAGSSIEKSKALGWWDSDLDFHFAYALWQCGHFEEALPLLQAFIERNPQSRFAPMASKLLGAGS